jgi:hypothetical protein
LLHVDEAYPMLRAFDLKVHDSYAQCPADRRFTEPRHHSQLVPLKHHGRSD